MELNEVCDRVMKNQQTIAGFEAWVKGIDHRVAALEKTGNMQIEVQLALRELSMSTKYFGEKLEDMKSALDKINDENKTQHDSLSNRIKKIEDQPAEKWNKASWIIIAAAISAAAGIIIGKLFI